MTNQMIKRAAIIPKCPVKSLNIKPVAQWYKYDEYHCPSQNHRKIINSIMRQDPTLSESLK